MARRVYLSGGMEYAADEGRDWRKEMQMWLERELGCTVFNPNVESDRFLSHEIPGIRFRELKKRDIGRYRQIVEKLVALDCDEIAARTDFLIVYWDDSAQRGAGTKGELTMAHFFRKPVYMVTAMPPEAIPGWVLGCTSRVFSDFSSLQDFLLSQRQAWPAPDDTSDRGGTSRHA
jgi:hypothetical protein